MSDLNKIIAAEEAKRAELEGKGKDKIWFEANKKNYLVEAGAGAGKTFIMVQRIVNQLVEGVYEPEDVVAITFTNKSTLELRERLDKQLVSRRAKLLEKGTLTQEERKQLKRLEYLIQESGRMQVSTIHSFCSTMLMSMPFSSPLGLDMELLEDEDPIALEFLNRKLRENPRRFRKAFDMGCTTRVLQKNFLARCKNGEVTVIYKDAKANPQETAAKEAEVLKAALAFHQALVETKVRHTNIDSGLLDIMELSSQKLARDRKALKYLIWKKLSGPDAVPTRWGLTGGQVSYFLRKQKDGKVIQAVWEGEKGAALQVAAGELMHSYVMTELVPLLEEYRSEKQRLHIATFNDLLLRARDMLRDDGRARAYFHERYKVLYVDEMQDTDPVQAEFLFYLTTDEEHFDASNWQNCRPVPGSLFLVGDPKQAIYRFRGADIDVYNTLLRLFRGDEEGSVGEKVTLQFNFRSAEEICRLSDEVFDLPADPEDKKDHHFAADKYHAEYVGMLARNGACPRARTVYYRVGKAPAENDPLHVAAFIRTMIDLKMPVGIHDPRFDKYVHCAEPRDFLILTSGKTHISEYSAALSRLNIPVQVTGEKKFEDTPPVRLAVLHLRSLLSLRDDPLLIRVLQDCYDVEIAVIHEFLQRTGEHSISNVTKKNKLQKIRLALQANKMQNTKVWQLCSALEEIAGLRYAAGHQPAMAVIEQLLEGGYGVWRDLSGYDLDSRRQVYSEVQLYLNLVRKAKERSFRALAAYAIECAGKSFEQELDLEPAANAVRIMNLHKAKGLEAEVVILAASWQMPRVPGRQVVRSGNEASEYAALVEQGDYKYATEHQVGFPEKWSAYMADEKKYAAAEYARLLYVALTRAKTMLVVFERDPTAGSFQMKTPSYWDPIIGHLDPLDISDPDYGKAFMALTTGAVYVVPPDPADGAAGVRDDEDSIDAAIDAIEPDDAGDAADDDALPGENAPAVSGDAADAQAQTNNGDDGSVRPDVMEKVLCEKAAALAVNSVYAITPSKLEKHAPRSHSKFRDDEEAVAAEAAEQQAAAAEQDDDEIPAKPETKPEPKEPPENTGPYGPEWGTMVHRVMELCVREGSYTVLALEDAARQAVKESLAAGLDPEHLYRLNLTAADDEETVIEKLVPEIMVTAVFLTSEITPLRQLMDGADAYPELPFILRAEADNPRTQELYQHLAAHISDENAAGRTLAVEGIIDLALRKDNAWYVVDYKTDRRNRYEEKEVFMQRLKDEYTPQITAYARVLEKMNGEKSLPVKGAWLCATALGGELIPLDI